MSDTAQQFAQRLKSQPWASVLSSLSDDHLLYFARLFQTATKADLNAQDHILSQLDKITKSPVYTKLEALTTDDPASVGETLKAILGAFTVVYGSNVSLPLIREWVDSGLNAVNALSLSDTEKTEALVEYFVLDTAGQAAYQHLRDQQTRSHRWKRSGFIAVAALAFGLATGTAMVYSNEIVEVREKSVELELENSRLLTDKANSQAAYTALGQELDAVIREHFTWGITYDNPFVVAYSIEDHIARNSSDASLNITQLCDAIMGAGRGAGYACTDKQKEYLRKVDSVMPVMRDAEVVKTRRNQ